MADPRIYFTGQPLIPIGRPEPTGRANLNDRYGSQSADGITFAGALQAAEKKVNFSRHAIERMESRQLGLTEHDLARLDDTVEKMAQKGAKESLIYLNDVALVVSVKSRTVITAMDGMSARDNIFTNIDSAAIL